MKKTFSIISLIAIVLLLIGPSIYLYSVYSDKLSNISVEKINQKIGDFNSYLEELSIKLKPDNFSVKKYDMKCSNLEGEYEAWTDSNLMGRCYTELAVITGDHKYCKKIKGKYLDLVKSSCYTATAFATDNPSVCGQYNSSYNNHFCYSWISNFKEDPDICKNINNTEDREECFWRHEEDYFSKDFFFCDDLENKRARDLCNQVEN